MERQEFNLNDVIKVTNFLNNVKSKNTICLKDTEQKEIIFFIMIVFNIQLNYLLASFDAPGSYTNRTLTDAQSIKNPANTIA